MLFEASSIRQISKKLSIFGVGYHSSFETLLTFSLKSPQMLTDFLSGIITGMISAAQLENKIAQ